MLAELIATEGVEEISSPRNAVGVMAIHGGLEEGTDDMRSAVAAAAEPLYTVVQPKTLRWHVPSISIRSRRSRLPDVVLGSVATVISIHGYGDPGFESTALLGGSNRRWQRDHDELAARGVAPSRSRLDPKRLRGSIRSIR